MTISDPIYGEIKITEPGLLELIATPAMECLRGIDQNVTASLIPVPWGDYSRFDHSLGVMYLIARFGGSVEEQIAGLLHDVSHTAFSHAMDYVFDNQGTQDFHEQHLARIVEQSNIPEILKRYGLQAERILNHANFSILEQTLPALCADRVDYALKTFHLLGVLPSQTISEFLHYLTTSQGKIVFTDEDKARQFAELFMNAENQVWGGGALGNLAYQKFSEIVKRAYDRGEIALDDFFTTDREFLQKLGNTSRKELEKLRNTKFREVTAAEDFDLHLNAKIRYVDPPVKINNEVKKLSEINSEFARELREFLEKRKRGNYVKIVE